MELENLSHPLDINYFKNDGSNDSSNDRRAKSEFILADSLPLVFVTLHGTKYLREGAGSVILQIKHFKKDEKFPKLEEIANYYHLEPRGTSEQVNNRR